MSVVRPASALIVCGASEFGFLAPSKCNRFGLPRLRPKAQIGPLMHAAGLCRKRRKGVWDAAEPHPDSLPLAERTARYTGLSPSRFKDFCT
jgi:hypothetical protein